MKPLLLKSYQVPYAVKARFLIENGWTVVMRNGNRVIWRHNQLGVTVPSCALAIAVANMQRRGTL